MRQRLKNRWLSLPLGTRSLLVGAHAFWLHPFLVWLGWIRLWGWTWSLPTIASFFLHDIGYWGCTNMDDGDGLRHPVRGAEILSKIFDKPGQSKWYDFSVCHSRKFAKEYRKSTSPLCWADKMAFVLAPRRLYLALTRLTGELDGYIQDSTIVYPSEMDWLIAAQNINMDQCVDARFKQLFQTVAVSYQSVLVALRLVNAISPVVLSALEALNPEKAGNNAL